MHDEANYRYVGQGRMGQLTNQELSYLQLGFLVRGEQIEKAQERDQELSRRKYSEPDQTLDEAMENYEQKIDNLE